MNTRKISQFQKKIWSYYKANARLFPWRKTRDPYKILVSEIMLQQTQTARVVPKYEAFIRRFPTVWVLAGATRTDVLSLWSGLGYNRRALYLYEAAKEIVKKYKGVVPTEKSLLVSLPGIGSYTAGAVLVFSKNVPDIFIETNIRTVYLHEFFSHTKKKVTDKKLLEYIKCTLPKKNIREWYWALMDYGVYLKGRGKRNKQSAHYAKQSTFKGSLRALRGRIIRKLLTSASTSAELKKIATEYTKDEFQKVLTDLEKEGFIVRVGTTISLQK